MALNAKKFGATVKQSLMAYAFNMFGIVAGTIVAYNAGLFERIPWAVAIYPPILSARGVIGGLFCGRLSTALHLGTIQPRWFGNTKSFYLLTKAIVVMTLETSIIMSFIAVLFKGIYAGITLDDLINIVNMVVATMALAVVVISPLTLTVSFLSFKHGLDPDIILYPIESTVADLLITTIYISMLNLFLLYNSFSKYFLTLVSLISISAALYLLIKNKEEDEFIKTLKESFLTIIFVSFIINVAGAVLGKIDETLRESRELYRGYPVYVVYPALIDTIGDIGATVGSTATTKLALGTLKSSFSSLKNHLAEISGAWIASLIMYLVYSILSLLIQGIFNPLNFMKFTAVLFTANIVAASCIILISYTVAILTYKKGLDPDNFEIPIESSFADSMTTLSLLVALVLLAGI
ncbi:MAG: magnesium transporter [Nitrososphaerota archaeon]|nr:magnesium transporter [Nitrososphaerota archaeon]